MYPTLRPSELWLISACVADSVRRAVKDQRIRRRMHSPYPQGASAGCPEQYKTYSRTDGTCPIRGWLGTIRIRGIGLRWTPALERRLSRYLLSGANVWPGAPIRVRPAAAHGASHRIVLITARELEIELQEHRWRGSANCLHEGAQFQHLGGTHANPDGNYRNTANRFLGFDCIH